MCDTSHDAHTYLMWVTITCRLTTPQWCHIRMCDMTHSHQSNNTSKMSHSHVWHDSLTCVTRVMTHAHMWYESRTYVRATPRWCQHLHFWHDSVICVTRVMTHAHTWHESYELKSEQHFDDVNTHTFDIAHSHVWHASWRTHMCDMSHTNSEQSNTTSMMSCVYAVFSMNASRTLMWR